MRAGRSGVTIQHPSRGNSAVHARRRAATRSPVAPHGGAVTVPRGSARARAAAEIHADVPAWNGRQGRLRRRPPCHVLALATCRRRAYALLAGRPADRRPGLLGRVAWTPRGGSLAAIIAAFGNSDEFVPALRRVELHRPRDEDLPAGTRPRSRSCRTRLLRRRSCKAGRRTLQSITLDVINGATTGAGFDGGRQQAGRGGLLHREGRRRMRLRPRAGWRRSDFRRDGRYGNRQPRPNPRLTLVAGPERTKGKRGP